MKLFKRKNNPDDIKGNDRASFYEGMRDGQSREISEYDEKVHWFKYWLGFMHGFDEDEKDDYNNG